MVDLDLAAPGPLVQSAGDAAAQQIRLAILDGRLEPGQRLKEAAVAEAFNISRTPVREALRRLEREGLVVATPNRGAAVRRYSADELRDVYELRALLEGHAARRAAGAVTAATLDALDESCARSTVLAQGEPPVIDLVRENARFHTLILDAAGSERLEGFVRAVTEMPLIYRTYAWYSAEQRRQAHREHERLVDALRAADAERAELIMRRHVLEGADVRLAHLDAVGGIA